MKRFKFVLSNNMNNLILVVTMHLAIFSVLFGQVQWVESKWEDFRDGAEIDPAMYVSRRANLESDSGCIEFFARFDVNNDGQFDLCCSDFDAGTKYVRLYYGANPATCSLMPITDQGGNCDLADLNLDGYAELIHSGHRSNSCCIYWGSPCGPSRTNTTLLPNNNAEAVYVSDLDKDGYLDIVLASDQGHLYIYWGPAPYSVGNRTDVTLGNPSGHNIEVADFDKDGWSDLAVIAQVSNNIAILKGRPNRTRQIDLTLPCYGPHGLSVADLDSNGYLDIVTTSYGGDASKIYWGSDSFFRTSAYTVVNPGSCYGGSAVYDFTGDGRLDILYYRGPTAIPIIYRNIGTSPWFTNSSTELVGSRSFFSSGGFVADINLDGNIDIFLNAYTGSDSSFILWGPSFNNTTAFLVNGDHHGVFREIGNIYDRSYSGFYASSIFDANQNVTSGFVSWIAYEPGGSQVKVKVRGGNIVSQDTIWTDWFYCSNNAALPTGVMNQTLYQYKVEFLYTTPCNLPWLEKISFDFNISPSGCRMVETQLSRIPAVRCQNRNRTWPFTFSRDGHTDFDRGKLNFAAKVHNPTNRNKWAATQVVSFVDPNGNVRTHWRGYFSRSEWRISPGSTDVLDVEIEPPFPLLGYSLVGNWSAKVVLTEKNSIFGSERRVDSININFEIKPRNEITVQPPPFNFDHPGGLCSSPSALTNPQNILYYILKNIEAVILLLGGQQGGFFNTYFDYVQAQQEAAEDVYTCGFINRISSRPVSNNKEITIQWGRTDPYWFNFDRALIIACLPEEIRREHIVDPGNAHIVENDSGRVGLVWILNAVDKKITPLDPFAPRNLTFVLNDNHLSQYQIKTSLQLQIGPFQNNNTTYEHLYDAPWIYNYTKWQNEPDDVFWITFSAVAKNVTIRNQTKDFFTDGIQIDHTIENELITEGAELHIQRFTFDDTVEVSWEVATELPLIPPNYTLVSMGYRIGLSDSFVINKPLTICLPYIDTLISNYNNLGIFHYDSVNQHWDYLQNSLIDTSLHQISAMTFLKGIYAVFESEDTLPYLPPVTLVSPILDSTVANYTPEFIWNDSSYLVGLRYQVQIDTTADFISPIFETTIDTTNFILSTTVQPDTYHWRVRRTNYSGFLGNWSEIARFIILQVPEQPFLLVPANLVSIGDSCPTFIWTSTIADSGTYTLQYALNDSFTVGLVIFNGITDTTFTVPVNIALSDTIYYWRVEAINQSGIRSGFQDEPNVFRVDTRVPESPTLIFPGDNGQVDSLHPRFSWNPQTDDWDSFVLQCAFDSLFTDSVKTFTNIYDTTFKILMTNTLRETTYYWRVKAIDGAGNEGEYQQHPFRFTVQLLWEISGNVKYYSNQNPVESTSVVLSAAIIDSILTDSMGSYSFDSLPSRQNYKASPYKINSARQTGVSSYDAALILRHVVGMITLDSLKRIAADVSGNGTISSFDAAQVLQYVVGIRNHFPVGHRPEQDTVDWAFRPESLLYQPLTTNQLNQDYRAILYGDPSGNWVPSDIMAELLTETDKAPTTSFIVNLPETEATETRITTENTEITEKKSRERQSTLPLIPSHQERGMEKPIDQQTKVENTARVSSHQIVYPVVAKGVKGLYSADIQVSYNSKEVRPIAIRNTEITKSFMIAGADYDGIIRIGLAGSNKLDGDLKLLEIVFEVTNQTNENELSELNNKDAASSDLNATNSSNIKIDWLIVNEGSEKPIADGTMGEETKLPTNFYLAPPKPNPFGKGTRISYDLPKTSDVRISIFDASGSLIKTLVETSQPAGHFSVIWDGKDKQGKQLANGIYFIRMKADTHEFLRKAVLLKQ